MKLIDEAFIRVLGEDEFQRLLEDYIFTIQDCACDSICLFSEDTGTCDFCGGPYDYDGYSSKDGFVQIFTSIYDQRGYVQNAIILFAGDDAEEDFE